MFTSIFLDYNGNSARQYTGKANYMYIISVPSLEKKNRQIFCTDKPHMLRSK